LIAIDSGFEAELISHAQKSSLPIEGTFVGAPAINYKYEISPEINYKTGVYGYQDRAVTELLKHSTARIQAPAGSGKTVLACLAIALLGKGPVLFLANKDRLLRQFRYTVTKVLGIPEEEIGLIKANKHIIKPITCGSLQTLGKENFDLEAIKTAFNVVFYDECHLSTALTYRRVLTTLAPERLYGLSATPEHYSSQDLSNLMRALLGEIVVTISDSEIPKRLTPQTYTRETGRTFTFKGDKTSPEWLKRKLRHKMQEDICHDFERNQLIVNDTLTLLNLGFKVLLCTSRVAHGEILHKMLTERGANFSFPYKTKTTKKGKVTTKVDHKRLDVEVDEVGLGKKGGIIGTYTLFDTGFDCPSLSALLLVGPFSGSNSTRIVQSVGRIQRFLPEKSSAVVIDYTDDSNPQNVLRTWAISRSEVYQRTYGRHDTIDFPE
jgi:superfamily II DNA or RNA helicase